MTPSSAARPIVAVEGASSNPDLGGKVRHWHVERQSVCIHSQLKRCSSSEVAAMIDGVLRHDTEMEVEKTYVDSHGQSEVAFAFCRMLGFELLPRLKAIASQRLHLPDHP